jgi:deoxyxylulose-5-phosphate synthase
MKHPQNKQADVFCMGIADHFVEHGARSILLNENALSAEKIVEFVKKLVVQDLT